MGSTPEEMISVIIPVFNEEKNILPLYEKLTAVLKQLQQGYEVIFIDDGSTDNTLNHLRRISKDDPSVKVISFLRNYGQTAALSAGIDFSKGTIIIPMDGDLQNDPEDIPLLLQKIEEGYDVVSGWRKDRRDHFLRRRFPSIIANKIISFLGRVPLHDYGCTLKAYKRGILKNIRLYGEMHRFIPIYAKWVGARVTEIPVHHFPRTSGFSKYGMMRIFKVILDLMVVKFLLSYSQKPIYVFGGMGFFMIFAGLSFWCLCDLSETLQGSLIYLDSSPFALRPSADVRIHVDSHGISGRDSDPDILRISTKAHLSNQGGAPLNSMCGIFGFLTRRQADVPDIGLLRKMRETMIHRGPDDKGEYIRPMDERGPFVYLGIVV